MKKLLASLFAALLCAAALPASAQFTQSSTIFVTSPGSGGSGGITIGGTITGVCTSGDLLYDNAGVIGCVTPATVSATPAAGDLSYWTSSSAQALLTSASGTSGAYLRSAGSGAAPIWSTLVLPNAASAGQIPIAASSNTITMSSTPTLGASGTLGTLTFGNATSGTILLTPPTGALGTITTTLPNASSTLPIFGQQVTFTGPTAARSYALPDASATLLSTNAAVTVAQGGTGATTVQAATQALSTPRIIYKQGLPMVYMASATATGSPTGTGAFTGLTALTGGVPTSAYCYMPAGANVDGASTAGWYYCTFSSTTAGTVYNNRYTPSSTPPTIPGSPAAPTTLTTWTSGTGSIDFVSFSVPANSMGINGVLDSTFLSFGMTSNANAKSWSLVFGGTTVVSAISLASSTTAFGQARVFNTGSASIQFTQINRNGTVNTGTASAVNTGNAATTTLSMAKDTATDNVLLQPVVFTLLSDGL